MPSFNRLNLTYSVNAQHFDNEGNEGIVGTSEMVQYVNLSQRYNSALVSGVPEPVEMMRVVGQYLLTSHKAGRVKLWNVESGEELRTYKWKNICREVYFDEEINRVVCFTGGHSVKLLNISKFTREEIYSPEDALKENSHNDYVVHSAIMGTSSQQSRWIFFKKGGIFTFDLAFEGKKKILKSEKILDLGYEVQEVSTLL